MLVALMHASHLTAMAPCTVVGGRPGHTWTNLGALWWVLQAGVGGHLISDIVQLSYWGHAGP